VSRRLGAARAGILAGALVAAIAGCGPGISGERLDIRTGAFNVGPGACPAALVPPFRIDRAGSELIFVDAGTGQRLSIVWPFGFAAWVENGRAVLYARDGKVVGREGDTLDNIGGGSTPDGDAILVCAVGVRIYT
jgi:hypothetical protein